MLLIANFGFAQKFGFKAGLNLMNMSHNYSIDNKMRTGYNLGFYFQKNILPTLSLRPEITYSQNGVTFYSNNLGEYTEDLNLNNLKLFLNVRFKPLIPIYVVAGPYLGYALSGTTHSVYKFGNIYSENTQEIDFDQDDINRLDYGISAGIGYILNLPLIGIFIEPRYELGMANLVDDNDYYMKNRNLTINAGVLIKL